MSILYGDVIDSSAIHTYSPCFVLFWNKKHENCTRTHALSNVSFRHQLPHLPLKLLSLFRIAPISRPIWYRCSWNKVNLMLNTSNWRQTTRNVIRKDILKFLQKNFNNTKTQESKSSELKNASLHTSKIIGKSER